MVSSLLEGLGTYAQDHLRTLGETAQAATDWRQGGLPVALMHAGLGHLDNNAKLFGEASTEKPPENVHPDAPKTEVPFAPLDPSRAAPGLPPPLPSSPEAAPRPQPNFNTAGAAGAGFRTPQLGAFQVPEMGEPHLTPRPGQQPDDLGYTYEDPEFTATPPEEAALENMFFSMGMLYGPQSEMGAGMLKRFDEIQQAKRQRLRDRAAFRAQMLDARHRADLQRRNQFDAIRSGEMQSHLDRKARLRNQAMQIQNRRDLQNAQMQLEAGLHRDAQAREDARAKARALAEQQTLITEKLPELEQRITAAAQGEAVADELLQMLDSGQISPGYDEALDPYGPRFDPNHQRAQQLVNTVRLQAAQMYDLGRFSDQDMRRIDDALIKMTDTPKAFRAGAQTIRNTFRDAQKQARREAAHLGLPLDAVTRDIEDYRMMQEDLRMQRGGGTQ